MIRYGLTSQKDIKMPTMVFKLERDAILFAQRLVQRDPAQKFLVQRLFVAQKGKTLEIKETA